MDRKDLIEKLKIIEAAAKKSEKMEHANGDFIFHSNKIIGYSGFVFAAVDFDHGLEDCALPKTLLQFLSKAKNKECEIHIDDTIQVVCGKFKVEYNKSHDSDDIFDFINDEIDFDTSGFDELPDSFHDAIEICRETIDPDKDDDFANIFIDGVTVVSGGFDAITAFCFKNKLDRFFVNTFAGEFVKKHKPKYYKATDAWLYMASDDGLFFSFRNYSDLFQKFEQWRDFFDFEDAGNEIVFPENIIEAVDAASIFKDDKEAIYVNIENDKIVIKADDFEMGKIIAEIECKNEFELKFGINADIFMKTLRHSRKCVCHENSLLFDCGNFRRVLSFVE